MVKRRRHNTRFAKAKALAGCPKGLFAPVCPSYRQTAASNCPATLRQRQPHATALVTSRLQETASPPNGRVKLHKQPVGKAPYRPNRPESQGNAAVTLRERQTLQGIRSGRTYPHGRRFADSLGQLEASLRL